MNLWAWEFKGAKTTGVGAVIANIEAGDFEPDMKAQGDVLHLEQLSEENKGAPQA